VFVRIHSCCAPVTLSRRFGFAGSFSRTAVNADCGAKSPVAGVVAALVVFLALYVITPALQYIPKAVLSAIVIVSILGLIDFRHAVGFWRVDKRYVAKARFGVLGATQVITGVWFPGEAETSWVSQQFSS
jgi:MFS superfamily sulfate permease-like transporter